MPKTYEQLTTQNTAVIKSNGGGNLSKTQGLTARQHFQDIIDFINGFTGGSGTQITVLADIAALKAQNTTSVETWPDNKLTYIIAEKAFYGYRRGVSASEDSVSFGQVLPTTGGGHHQRLSNVNRTFSTTSALLTFLNARPEGEVGQVRNSYGRLVKDAGTGLSVSQADHSHDLDKSCIIDDNDAAVIVYDRSVDTLLSITDAGFIPYAVKINPFDNNQAAIRWRDAGFTTYKTTLVNLTTGVKTAITGAGTTNNNYIDFSSTRLILTDTAAVRLVALSGLAVTTITPLHSIDPKFISVSPDGEYVAFAGNTVAKMGFIVLDDTSDVDYVDIQGNPASIGWTKDDNENKMWAFAYTPTPEGVSTVFVNPSELGVYVVKDYQVSGLIQINDGFYSRGLMPIKYYGLIAGTLGDSLFWELEPETGRMFTYSLPFFQGLASCYEDGWLIAYQGSDNNVYVFDRADKIVHLVGDGTMSLYNISWGTAFNLMLSGDGTSQDVIYFSGLNNRDNGSYMQSDGVLIRLLPGAIAKTPYAAGTGPSSLETDVETLEGQVTTLQIQVAALDSVNPVDIFAIGSTGLTAGDIYYKSESGYAKASASASSTARVRGIVQSVVGSVVTGQRVGSYLDMSAYSLDTGKYYFLGTSGRPTLIAPTASGEVQKYIIVEDTLVNEDGIINP